LATGAAILALSGLSVLGAAVGAEAADAADLWVATPGLGGQPWNHACTQDAPCGSLQEAVDRAADPANTGKSVTIHLGPGTFGSPGADVHVHAGGPAALTIAGYGSVGTTATVLTPGAAGIGQLDALRIDTVAFPVSVAHLSIGPARGAAGTAGTEPADGSSVHGILSLSTAALAVDDVRISDLTGGDGAAGGQGGDVIGIAHAGPSTITRTVITGLRGGTGGRGADGDTPTAGGTGGSAISVVASLPPAAGLTVSQSQFSDNTGGTGGPGGARSTGTHAGQTGGEGGSAVGITLNGDSASINGVTVARMQGGAGGAGGAGHALRGAPDAGPDGAGGAADGLVLTGIGTAAPAAATVTNSTIGDNAGGVGSPLGAGVGINLGLTGGGTGTATLVHNTVVNNRGALDLSGGVLTSGPDVTQAASVLDNPQGSGDPANCVRTGPGTLTDAGYNAVSDPAAGSCGNAPSDVATTTADLGPLQNNGGLTDTRALAPGSPAATAVDAAVAATAVAQSGYCAGSLLGVDQRALARPTTGHCAAGAFQPEPTAPAAPPQSAPPNTPVAAKPTPVRPVAGKPGPKTPTAVKPAPGPDRHPHGRWAPAPYRGPRTKIAPGHHKPGHHPTHHRRHGKRRG
jgi:hypothetical protein